jgi:hypothetical protein
MIRNVRVLAIIMVSMQRPERWMREKLSGITSY